MLGFHHESALDGMPTWQWDSNTSTDLEVAVNFINLLIPRYRARISGELDSAVPDEQKIQAWQRIVNQAVIDQAKLLPSQPDAVRSAVEFYGRLYREDVG